MGEFDDNDNLKTERSPLAAGDKSRESTHQTSYRYEPLNKEGRWFRVLTLHPSNDKSAPIHCTLDAHSLDKLPHYEALSYTWGLPGDNASNPVYISQCPVVVSSNLYDALQMIRRGTQDKPRTLWVDALSINQADNAEKAVQVSLMGTIYSKARCVLVWLGRASDDSPLAMTTLSGLRKPKDLQALSPEANGAIGKLFSRAWFTRVWTIQEWGLARKNEFLCGEDVVPWEGMEDVLADLLRAARNWGRDGRESKRGESEILQGLERGDIWARLLTDRGDVLVPGYGNYVKTRSFLALLEQHIGLEATQQRDRIFGLMSLAQRNGTEFTGRQHVDLNQAFSDKMSIGIRSAARDTAVRARALQPPPPSPVVDYDKPEAEVFTEWARWIIEAEKKLDILFTIQMTEKRNDLPSWVPSWKARSDSDMILRFSDAMLVFHAWTRIPVIQGEKKSVTFASVDVSFSENSRELSVLGVRLGEIDSTCELRPVQVEEWENLLHGFIPEGYLDGKVPMKHRRQFSVPVLDKRQEKEDNEAAERRRPARKEKLRRTLQQNRVQFQNSSKGSMKGIVPKEAMSGDLLVVFKAVETPFLIRSTDKRAKRFKIIGEAFVDGFMKSWDSKVTHHKEERERFVLC
ncbi:MAG: hypothetical protein Q9160_004618 [Pyrenula sp. 1 TL-2023]